MFDELKKQATLVQILLVLLILAVGVYLLGIAWNVLSNFSDIIVILVVSWLLSFVLEPMAEFIASTTNFPKIWATLITYLLVFGLLVAGFFIFLPTVQMQIQTLINILPNYLRTAPAFVTHWSDTVLLSLNGSISLLPSVANFLFDLLLVLIFSFYFVVDKESINHQFYALTPKNWHSQMRFAQKVIDTTFASFLRVQVTFGLIAGIVTWIVLTVFGVGYADSTAFLAGIFSMIPFLGPFLGIIPPILIVLITVPSDLVIIFVILLLAQQLIFNVLGPKLLGNAFKVHPAVILLGFLIGIKIAGGVGAIFSIPVVGIVTLITREIRKDLRQKAA